MSRNKLHMSRSLLISTEENQAEAVRILLQKGADADHKGLFGRAALHVALQNNLTDIVQMLTAHNANINMEDDFGRTPLYVACEIGTLEEVRILLDKGADANIIAHNKTSPLHLATSRDDGEHVVLSLLKHGADIHAVDGYNKSPLHWACAHGDYEVVRLLLEKGANHQVVDEEYAKPADVAVRHGHHGIADLITRFASHQLKNAVDVETQTDTRSIYSIFDSVDSDDFNDLKMKLRSITGEIDELEGRLECLESEKLEMEKNRNVLKPRLDVANNFSNLNSNDETVMAKWNERKSALTEEWNNLIGQETKLIEKIRTLALQIKVLKIERVQVYVKMDDLVTSQLQNILEN